MKKFDVLVVGSGAGLEVASFAAERGLSAALVEEGPLGGTCPFLWITRNKSHNSSQRQSNVKQ